MHIFDSTAATPFEAMLIDLLARQLPGERMDIKAAKAATLAKVIVAEMARRQITTINTGDILTIQHDYRWAQSQIDAVAKSHGMMTVECLDSFPNLVATTIREHRLIQMKQSMEPGENGDDPVSVLRTRVDLIVPGYDAYKAQQEATPATGTV